MKKEEVYQETFQKLRTAFEMNRLNPQDCRYCAAGTITGNNAFGLSFVTVVFDDRVEQVINSQNFAHAFYYDYYYEYSLMSNECRDAFAWRRMKHAGYTREELKRIEFAFTKASYNTKYIKDDMEKDFDEYWSIIIPNCTKDIAAGYYLQLNHPIYANYVSLLELMDVLEDIHECDTNPEKEVLHEMYLSLFHSSVSKRFSNKRFDLPNPNEDSLTIIVGNRWDNPELINQPSGANQE